jgi:hypothetical protein
MENYEDLSGGESHCGSTLLASPLLLVVLVSRASFSIRFSQLCLLDVELWCGNWDREWACVDLGVEKLDIYRSPLFPSNLIPKCVLVNQLKLFGCLMWNTLPFRCSTVARNCYSPSLKHLDKDISFSHWETGSKGTHPIRSGTKMTFLFSIAHQWVPCYLFVFGNRQKENVAFPLSSFGKLSYSGFYDTEIYGNTCRSESPSFSVWTLNMALSCLPQMATSGQVRARHHPRLRLHLRLSSPWEIVPPHQKSGHPTKPHLHPYLKLPFFSSQL